MIQRSITVMHVKKKDTQTIMFTIVKNAQEYLLLI
ncbi:hypothetical protein Goklo_025791 [Gossypium klotzschianum]|uniref:Uncharacterized protein n=1 Tax=Gossypium klotzschianum TaxID=34286 RepID=A0A7J8TSV8_9ROSI|nr:hypothetical protein [Gossypium klotzschianum]